MVFDIGRIIRALEAITAEQADYSRVDPRIRHARI